MNLIIVGGLGYIGRHLAQAALEKGWNVKITTRRPRKPPPLLEEAEIITLPEGKPPSTLREADAIYYMPGAPGGRKNKLLHVHYTLAREWASYAAEIGARFIYMSSIAVTADFSNDLDPRGRIVEEYLHLSGRKPEEASSLHAWSKSLMEKELVEGDLGKLLKGKYSIARPGLVYGGSSPHIEWKLINLLAKLRVRLTSKYLPVINVNCLARMLLDHARGKYDGLWINYLEDSTLEEVIDRLYGSCRGPCLHIGIDWTPGLLRLQPKQCKGRLAYSILRRKRRYSSRIRGMRECI